MTPDARRGTVDRVGPLPIEPVPPRTGQEWVWDYPRPPALVACEKEIAIELAGDIVALTRHSYRVLETSHPPVYYLPPEDIRADLVPLGGGSVCEWKGVASFFDVAVRQVTAPRAAWAYPDPAPAYRPIAGFVAFYPAAMDRCAVDGEIVRPQPGGFYGGWITDDVVGPFKGDPGTWGW